MSTMLLLIAVISLNIRHLKALVARKANGL